MTLEQRVTQLEKEMADFRRQSEERPEEQFIPEDSNGKHFSINEKSIKNPYSAKI